MNRRQRVLAGSVLAVLLIVILFCFVVASKSEVKLKTCNADLNAAIQARSECENKTCIDVYKYTILAADNQAVMSAAQTLSDEIDNLNAKLRHCGCMRGDAQ